MILAKKNYYLNIVFLLATICLLSTSCSKELTDLKVMYEYQEGYYLKSESTGWESKKYDYIGSPEHQTVAVGVKNKFGAMNKNEKVIVPLEYEFVKTYHSIIVAHQPPLQYEASDHIHVFNNQGDLLFAKTMMSCGPISDDLFYVNVTTVDGYIYNVKGEEVFKYTGGSVEEVSDDLYKFKTKKGVTLINGKGEVQPAPKLESTYHVDSDYILVVEGNDGSSFKSQLYDADYNKVEGIPDSFQVSNVTYHYAVLRKNEFHYEIYDLKNKHIIPNSYSQQSMKVVRCNEEDLSSKVYFDGLYRNGKYGVIGEEGNQLSSFDNNTFTYNGIANETKEERYRFLFKICDEDTTRIPIKNFMDSSPSFLYFRGLDNTNYFLNRRTGAFEQVDEYRLYGNNEGLPSKKFSIVKASNGNFKGLINENCELIIPLEYDNIEPAALNLRGELLYSRDFFTLKKDGKIGATDNKGNVVLKPEYDKIVIFGFDRGYFIVEKDNKYYRVCFSGRRLDDKVYDSLEEKYHPYLSVRFHLKNKEEELIIDRSGRKNKVHPKF